MVYMCLDFSSLSVSSVCVRKYSYFIYKLNVTFRSRIGCTIHTESRNITELSNHAVSYSSLKIATKSLYTF
jgi:hypothetical protein